MLLRILHSLTHSSCKYWNFFKTESESHIFTFLFSHATYIIYTCIQLERLLFFLLKSQQTFFYCHIEMGFQATENMPHMLLIFVLTGNPRLFILYIFFSFTKSVQYRMLKMRQSKHICLFGNTLPI